MKDARRMVPFDEVFEVGTNLFCSLVLHAGDLSRGLEGCLSGSGGGSRSISETGRVHATSEVALRVEHVRGIHCVSVSLSVRLCVLC